MILFRKIFAHTQFESRPRPFYRYHVWTHTFAIFVGNKRENYAHGPFTPFFVVSIQLVSRSFVFLPIWLVDKSNALVFVSNTLSSRVHMWDAFGNVWKLVERWENFSSQEHRAILNSVFESILNAWNAIASFFHIFIAVVDKRRCKRKGRLTGALVLAGPLERK